MGKEVPRAPLHSALNSVVTFASDRHWDMSLVCRADLGCQKSLSVCGETWPGGIVKPSFMSFMKQPSWKKSLCNQRRKATLKDTDLARPDVRVSSPAGATPRIVPYTTAWVLQTTADWLLHFSGSSKPKAALCRQRWEIGNSCCNPAFHKASEKFPKRIPQQSQTKASLFTFKE